MVMPPTSASIIPRLLDRNQAATYLGVSVDTVDRLIRAGMIGVVKLPVERSRHTGRGVMGVNRRILVDRVQIDEQIVKWRERAEPVQGTSPYLGTETGSRRRSTARVSFTPKPYAT